MGKANYRSQVQDKSESEAWDEKIEERKTRIDEMRSEEA